MGGLKERGKRRSGADDGKLAHSRTEALTAVGAFDRELDVAARDGLGERDVREVAEVDLDNERRGKVVRRRDIDAALGNGGRIAKAVRRVGDRDRVRLRWLCMRKSKSISGPVNCQRRTTHHCSS